MATRLADRFGNRTWLTPYCIPKRNKVGAGRNQW
jgi:hypothetical protein